MSIAVALRDVHKHFGRLHALRGIDLEIMEGEFFGLLGPNGAGKSTLISILAGLTRASSGSAAIFGHDVVTDYVASRGLLGVVPQELVFDPFFTVREVLRIQAGYFGKRNTDSWIDELLVALNLADKANANMRSLSGGMKRRVLIAQALAHRPRVLLLDEPTAGVDVELRRTLWEFAERLHREGTTIILTTHYLEEAEALCDRIAILNHGSVAALDDKQSLLTKYPTYEVNLRVDPVTGPLPAALDEILIDSKEGWLSLRVVRDSEQLASALTALHDAGLRVYEVNTRERTLENVFLELTGGAAESDTQVDMGAS